MLKPGETVRQAKIGWAARFRPWDSVFITGAYYDDINAAFQHRAAATRRGRRVVLAVAALAATADQPRHHDVAGPAGTLMARLADGDLAMEIPDDQPRR